MDGIGASGLKTKLIINYLPQSMSDNDFRNLFSTVGPLESYKVMRDKATNYSFGYGFVDYQTPEDASAAITKLNGYKIENKTLRVAYSKPQGSTRNINLYITGLGPTTDENKLRELFTTYGEVVQTKVVRDEGNSSKGYGFVLFKDKAQADASIRGLQGYCDGYGMNLQIKYAKDSSEQQRSHEKYQEFLRSKYQHPIQPVAMSYAGEYVVPVAGGPVPYDPSSTYGGGYSTVVRGRGGRGGITTRFNPIARPIGAAGGMTMGLTGVQDGTPTVIFAYNIGPNATESDMYGLFSKYGRITKVDVIQGKGYGFVHMPIAYEASEAVRALNGEFYNGKHLQVSIKSKK